MADTINLEGTDYISDIPNIFYNSTSELMTHTNNAQAGKNKGDRNKAIKGTGTIKY